MSAFITRRGGASSGNSEEVVSGTFDLSSATNLSVTIPDLIGKSRFVIAATQRGSGSYVTVFIRYIDGDILEYGKSGYNIEMKTYTAGSDESAAHFDPATGKVTSSYRFMSTEYDGDGPYRYTVFG